VDVPIMLLAERAEESGFDSRLEQEMSLKNAVFWDVKLFGSCKNGRFVGTQRLHHQGDKNRWTRNNVSRN
jgi:hypothetical protein